MFLKVNIDSIELHGWINNQLFFETLIFKKVLLEQ